MNSALRVACQTSQYLVFSFPFVFYVLCNLLSEFNRCIKVWFICPQAIFHFIDYCSYFLVRCSFVSLLTCILFNNFVKLSPLFCVIVLLKIYSIKLSFLYASHFPLVFKDWTLLVTFCSHYHAYIWETVEQIQNKYET